eukprot:763017-Hanusia_phi.AAC.4
MLGSMVAEVTGDLSDGEISKGCSTSTSDCCPVDIREISSSLLTIHDLQGLQLSFKAGQKTHVDVLTSRQSQTRVFVRDDSFLSCEDIPETVRVSFDDLIHLQGASCGEDSAARKSIQGHFRLKHQLLHHQGGWSDRLCVSMYDPGFGSSHELVTSFFLRPSRAFCAGGERVKRLSKMSVRCRISFSETTICEWSLERSRACGAEARQGTPASQFPVEEEEVLWLAGGDLPEQWAQMVVHHDGSARVTMLEQQTGRKKFLDLDNTDWGTVELFAVPEGLEELDRPVRGKRVVILRAQFSLEEMVATGPAGLWIKSWNDIPANFLEKYRTPTDMKALEELSSEQLVTEFVSRYTPEYLLHGNPKSFHTLEIQKRIGRDSKVYAACEQEASTGKWHVSMKQCLSRLEQASLIPDVYSFEFATKVFKTIRRGFLNDISEVRLDSGSLKDYISSLAANSSRPALITAIHIFDERLTSAAEEFARAKLPSPPTGVEIMLQGLRQERDTNAFMRAREAKMKEMGCCLLQDILGQVRSSSAVVSNEMFTDILVREWNSHRRLQELQVNNLLDCFRAPSPSSLHEDAGAGGEFVATLSHRLTCSAGLASLFSLLEGLLQEARLFSVGDSSYNHCYLNLVQGHEGSGRSSLLAQFAREFRSGHRFTSESCMYPGEERQSHAMDGHSAGGDAVELRGVRVQKSRIDVYDGLAPYNPASSSGDGDGDGDWLPIFVVWHKLQGQTYMSFIKTLVVELSVQGLEHCLVFGGRQPSEAEVFAILLEVICRIIAERRKKLMIVLDGLSFNESIHLCSVMEEHMRSLEKEERESLSKKIFLLMSTDLPGPDEQLSFLWAERFSEKDADVIEEKQTSGRICRNALMHLPEQMFVENLQAHVYSIALRIPREKLRVAVMPRLNIEVLESLLSSKLRLTSRSAGEDTDPHLPSHEQRGVLAFHPAHHQQYAEPQRRRALLSSRH